MKLLISLVSALTFSAAFGQATDSIPTPKMMEVIMNVRTDNHSILFLAEPGSTLTIHSMNGFYVGTWKFESEDLTITDLPNGYFIAVIEKNGQQIIKRILMF
jgi:hypothetical protein